MKFKIIAKCFQDASEHKDPNIDFYLEESDWDNYGYMTTYGLHISKEITKKDKTEYLGSINIMQKGQPLNKLYLLRTLCNDKEPVFTELPDDFISLTFSVEIFQELNRYLDTDQRKQFVDALHLILSNESQYYDSSLEDDDCFNKSLLRNASLDDYSLMRGRLLLEGEASYYDLRTQNLKVNFSHIEDSVSLDFSCIDDLSSDLLPNGISVFIGKNGSGKSTAIYKLAKLLYSDPRERFRIKDSDGQLIEPNNIGVNKLFLITYSPFDNFVMPAITNSDYQLMFSKDTIEEQRFIFCGIRDLKEEYKSIKDNSKNTEVNEVFVQKDRQDHTILKSIDQISEEFTKALYVIFSKRGNRLEMWKLLCENCKEFQPTLYNDIILFSNPFNEGNDSEKFKILSTGHKFILHTLAHLIAYIDDDSLVLFDEPENHLHPPLLSFLMTQMRVILAQYKSVMLIATHSPVVLQEVFAKNVYIVRRDGDNTTIRKPRIETYGENLSTITSEVFDLTSDVTKFYDAFNYLYEEWSMQDQSSIESMLTAFKEKIGHQLSNQMESYLINIHENNKKDVEIK